MSCVSARGPRRGGSGATASTSCVSCLSLSYTSTRLVDEVKRGERRADPRASCPRTQAGEKRLQEEAGELLGPKDRPQPNPYTQELLDEMASWEAHFLENDGWLLYLYALPSLPVSTFPLTSPPLPRLRPTVHSHTAKPSSSSPSCPSHPRPTAPAHPTPRPNRSTTASRRSRSSSARSCASRGTGVRGSRLQSALTALKRCDCACRALTCAFRPN